MKKFKFNFSFLERFKKNAKSENEHVEEEIKDTHQDEDVEEIEENEEVHHVEENADQLHSAASSEFESSETPEEFAEKTLGGFNIDKLKQQLKEADPNFITESSEDNEPTDHNFQFNEMPLPGKPEAAAPKRFNFKFPKFGRENTTDKNKAGFAGKSAMDSFEKISWNDLVLRLFSPYTRSKVHSLFLVLLVVTVTYMVGKNLALFFNKAPPVAKVSRPAPIPIEKADTTLQDLNKITSTNLFNVKESDKSGSVDTKKDIDSIVCLDSEKPTNMQIKLLDTIVLQDSVKSVASVQFRGSSELTNVREGERLDNMAEVSKIGRMRLILKNLETGDCEYAASDAEVESPMPDIKILSPKAGKSLFKSSNPSIKNVGNTFKIKKTFRDAMINNMSDLLTQAKALQITNPDGTLCFKMTEIVPGSLYTQLNIQENDVICNINGKKIDNLNELMGLLGRMKEIDQFQIGLKRNGMSENLEYGFE
ncbi:MAG: PDZ domain-containing protein [Bacteriovorax sp.]|jgi:type II secretory pathway component PulC